MHLITKQTLVARKLTSNRVTIYVPQDEVVEAVGSASSGEVSVLWRGQRLLAMADELNRVTGAQSASGDNFRKAS